MLYLISICLPCSRLELIRHCLWRKQHYDAILSSRNLRTACYTPWHSQWKLQDEDCRMFSCHSENRFIFILMISWLPVYIRVFGLVTSNGDIPPFIFSYGLRLKLEAYIKCLEEVMLLLTIRGWLLKDPTTGIRTLHHVTQVVEPSFVCEKISVITSPVTFGNITSQIAIPLIIYAVQLSKRLTKFCATPKMNQRQW